MLESSETYLMQQKLKTITHKEHINVLSEISWDCEPWIHKFILSKITIIKYVFLVSLQSFKYARNLSQLENKKKKQKNAKYIRNKKITWRIT